MMNKPTFIAGPCVIESQELLNTVAEELVRLNKKYDIDIIFKASFDKANRTSIHSFRGPGLDKGLMMLQTIKEKYGLRLLTDIHESYQAEAVGEVIDVIQIPAFLCRQTDLLVAAAKTGKIVNIKKAQFLSGRDMRYPVQKCQESGAKDVWLTERGNSFGYNNLVVDFRNIPDMKEIVSNVIMDCTHSVQRPSAGDGKTVGDRKFVPSMALAAKAFGATGYFFEVHPTPDAGLSDAANMLELEAEQRLTQVRAYATQCIKEEAEATLNLINQLDENFDKAVSLMFHCTGKVIVTGVGKSGNIGAKIAATLSSTGTPAFFVNPLDVYHGDLGVMTKDDVVLALSNSGQTDELLRFIPMVLHMNIPIIGMSANPNSLLAKYSTAHLKVWVEKEACPLNLAPTSSTTAALVMGDALAIALMRVRNFKPQDFAQFHPGGELGKRLLTTAQDVMRSDELPIIPKDMHLGEAIIHVSKGKLGLGVSLDNGKVIGLITDGDIRRAMERWQAEFFDHTVSDIMTREPKIVLPTTKITEIQQIMQQNKVHTVLVCDKERHFLGVVDHYSCML